MNRSKEQGEIIMALTLIKSTDVDYPSKAKLTPENNIQTLQNTLKNFLAWHYDSGTKLTQSKPRNLVVKRSNGRNLAIKISNHTWNLVPLTNERDDVEQIKEVIEELPHYSDRLFAFKKWCNLITGVKDGAEKHPRPKESF